jgi:Rieske Fe-S protein
VRQCARNDQERFEDYLELEHVIEELQAGRALPASIASMPRQAHIYSMVMLLRSASSEGTEPRPEFVAALWTRLEQELQHFSTSRLRSFPHLKKRPEKVQPISRRAIITGGAVATASLLIGIGGEQAIEQSEQHKAPATAGASAGRARSTPLQGGVPTAWYFVTTLARLGGEVLRFTTETIVGFVLREGGGTAADQANIIALSAACTHMGCIVQWHTSDRKFHCPCHGALFTAYGAVDKHSALLRSLSPLPRLGTRVEQGSIYVNVPVGRH